MKKEIKIFSSPIELAENFARELVRMINVSADKKKTITIALSGGTTPKILYSVLGNHFSDSVHWEFVHFFWGDERCVPPEDPESNFGMAKRILFDKIRVPSANIHRIMGEKDPSKEATRYSNEIAGHIRERRGSPVFDMIILGLGDDGHTASIFPANCELLKSKHICEVSVNPKSLQKRITITGTVINNAEKVVFIVTGENKAEVASAIINNTSVVNYPAAHIEPKNGILKWYLDIAAGKMIDRSMQN